ncbi:alpha/beta fold hydrolase [Luteolibacter sp. LG18]|uniref:alpha/beta hydrolase n=1 Tax=Luteolibacter sp. LG18 TaxID=2819286 RepID=UPI002B2EB07A|nr:alpha/beta hydrolase [Luteolibacter sp. LG18]
MLAAWAVGIAPLLAADPAPRPQPKSPRELIHELSRDPNGDWATVARAFLGKNGGNSLFYYPTRDTAETPATWGWKFENVWFKSADGTRLHGWFLPAGGKTTKGTIVFSHGNTGAMGYHLGFVSWLLPEGFNVLVFDYRGFGSSGGVPVRHGMIEDVRAAFDYVRTRRDIDVNRIVSMGHSLGASKSITALAEKPIPGVRAIVSDSGFASYTGMADAIAGKVGTGVVSDEWSPKDWVAKLAPLPLLVIHGTDDEVVPFAQGQQLFAAAAAPKTMFTVQGGHHGNSLWRNNGEYRKKMLEWLATAMK